MRPIEEQLARLADHAMAAGRAPSSRRPARRLWAFVAIAGLVGVAATATVVVLVGDQQSSTVVPATDPDTGERSTMVTGAVDSSVTPTSTMPTSTSDDGSETTAAPLVAPVMLRPDGVGDFDLGSPMATVIPALDALLGPGAVTDHGESNDPVIGCSVHVTAYWAQAGLTLGFSDTGSDVCSGEPVLVGWQLQQPVDGPVAVELRFADGLGLGSTFDQFTVGWPGLTLYPDDGGLGSGAPDFATADVERSRMAVEFGSWDWISAVQTGLVANGYEVAVDGQIGPATSAAYTSFAAAHPGVPDGELFVLLGAVPPVSAPAISIAAGRYWFWETELVCDGSPSWTLYGDNCS